MRNLLLFFILVHLSCAAAPLSVVRQADNLRLILRQADEAYYNHHSSLMSDAAYDALRSQYDRLAAEYPELAAASPVGAPPSGPANPVEHSSPILSLQKAYTDEAVEAFLWKCGTNLLYCVEPKIDGLTVVLRYCNGLLVQALTRGDGQTGIDVTAAIFASGVVPVALSNAPAQLDVRGEVFLTFPAFEALNHRREAAGLSSLKSPRSAAAGTLRLSDYVEIARRSLSIRIFELLATEPPMPPTHTEALALLKSVGLPIIESQTIPADDVLPAIESLNQWRVDFPFPTDGIVIKVDDRAAFEHLGSTAHHPRGALARKYQDVPEETRLLAVDWTRGATGKLTPVARFNPVEIHGATIQNATLHNLAHIRAIDLRIGDCILVIRSGGAVPEIIGVCPERRTGSETSIPDPSP